MLRLSTETEAQPYDALKLVSASSSPGIQRLWCRMKVSAAQAPKKNTGMKMAS